MPSAFLSTLLSVIQALANPIPSLPLFHQTTPSTLEQYCLTIGTSASHSMPVILTNQCQGLNGHADRYLVRDKLAKPIAKGIPIWSINAIPLPYLRRGNCNRRARPLPPTPRIVVEPLSTQIEDGTTAALEEATTFTQE
ncbi:hypothetical protein PHLCEN_2v1900 [Hermanssonia centrifuga]|uniref:Uncharacterized protein n=1 Tax=Hermanssonia centrifuga TaxID=98765 RepID=A0A2R6RVK8_9APHY|nr:hypothetical protein PHLCEN_2v1900 [Hermanssonia centrifuga]